MNKPAVFAKNITVFFEKNPIIWEVGFSIPPGKMVAIIGPNGAGKSTLLKVLLGILKPLSGTVLFFDSSYEKIRKKVAYVPQREGVDWDFPIRVIDVALMGCYARGSLFHRPSKRDKKETMEMLEILGLLPFANRQINELSGGQQQRLFIARALLQQADVYLLDEPFAGVDVMTEKCIIDLLKTLKAEGKTMLIVHHDLNTVEAYFDWVLLLNRRLVAIGEKEAVFNHENLKLTYGNIGTLLEEGTRRSKQKSSL